MTIPVSQQSSSRNANRTLLILWGVFAIAQLDRQILSLSLDTISIEFGLSDFQLGLLSGFAFAVVFVVVGFPVAALCARYNRRNIVSVSVFVWSGFTILMAAAQNFAQLFMARVGVGAGEAGAVAPAHSIISDLYPEGRHTSTLSTFATGANAGILLAAIIGGVLGQLLGWRWAVVIAGVPGLFISVLLYRFGTEPVRGKSKYNLNLASIFTIVWRAILQDPGLRYAFVAFSMMGVLTFGMIAWVPTLIIRQYGLTLVQVGGVSALSAGIIGGLGTYLCGRMIDRAGRKRAHYRLYALIGIILINSVFGTGFLLSQEIVLGLSFLVVSTFTGFAFWGATFAYVYKRLESHLRPMATAFFLLSFNLFGMGFGPTIVGFSSDFVFTDSPLSIAYSLLMLKVFGLIAMWFYFKMARLEAKSG